MIFIVIMDFINKDGNNLIRIIFKGSEKNYKVLNFRIQNLLKVSF